MNVKRTLSGQNSKTGFTLIELLVAIAIIAIAVAVTLPGIINWLPSYKLKGAARDLYSVMQKARSIAVKSNRNTAIIFIPASNAYELCDEWVSGACVGNVKTVDLGSEIKFGHGNATADVTGAAFPANNVSYIDDHVVFEPRGFGTSGYAYLDHHKNTTTYAIGSQTSGSIRILKWQGGSWR